MAFKADLGFSPYLPFDVVTEDGEFRVASIYGVSENRSLDEAHKDTASRAVAELFAEVLNRLPEIAALPGFGELVERASAGIEAITADDEPAPRP